MISGYFISECDNICNTPPIYCVIYDTIGALIILYIIYLIYVTYIVKK